jgi:hypothetical protein
MIANPTKPLNERQWFIVQRWQEYDGESRANLLRIIAIGAFYIVELIRFYLLGSAHPELLPFHRQATLIAVAWTMVALVILLCLRLKIFPAGLKYASTTADVLLLATLAAIAEGPFGPLVLAFFLIIALAALRFSVGLIWYATAMSMLGYWSLVGLADAKTGRWFDAQHAVPVVTQLLTLLTLALTGVVLGQVVRQARQMSAEYARRLPPAEKTE